MSVFVRKKGKYPAVIEKHKDEGEWKSRTLFTLEPYSSVEEALEGKREAMKGFRAEVQYAQKEAHKVETIVCLLWEGPLERYHNGRVPKLEDVQVRVLEEIEEAEQLPYVRSPQRAAKEVLGEYGYLKDEPGGYTGDFTLGTVIGTVGMDDFIYALRVVEEWRAEVRQFRKLAEKCESEVSVLEGLVSK